MYYLSFIRFIILCLLSSICLAQTGFEKKYGIGMMVVSYDSNFVLNLYATPHETDLALNVRVGKDTTDESGKLTFKLSDEQRTWIHPETFWDEEQLLHFVTLEAHQGWFKIIVDKQSGKTMWVLQCAALKYFAWKDYLPNTTGIERKNNGANPIYQCIFPYKKALHFKEQEGLKIIKVRGKWAKIGFNPELSPHLNQYATLPKGWIKWRDEEDLLIRYFLR